MSRHIVQSLQWSKFKNEYGTKSIHSDDIFFTLHKIPLTDYYFAYCPKVSPENVNFTELTKSLLDHNCIAINFDVPNLLVTDPNASKVEKEFLLRCVKSPKDTFARFNILLDILRSEEELLANMHHKHRYNLKYAQKNGLKVKLATTFEDFNVFFSLLAQTSLRQKYFIHPKSYYQKIWEILSKEGMVKILSVYKEDIPLASWMLFTYEGVLYYPYGGSSEEFKNLHASTLLAWEAIKLGKQLGCTQFDMWGASSDPNNESDPWYGFTNFKLKFGGRLVEYIASYDMVLNHPAYKAFNFANELRWKILRFIK